MEKEFVTYEQALALKELGFDEPCFGFYKLKHSNIYYNTIVQTQIHKFRNNSDLNLYSDLKEKIAAPLKQQSFKWFRDKHEIEVTIACFYNNKLDMPYGKRVYHCHIVRDGITTKGPKFKTYEEGESTCIDKLIEIVKKK